MSAQKAYAERLRSIRNQIAELQMHFGEPGVSDANWGHVGDLFTVDQALKEITDRVFKRGEYEVGSS